MNRISRLICVFCGLFPLADVSGQGFQVVFPLLSGDELIDSLSAYYRPDVVLDYTNSRDTLYHLLSENDDSLRCIYSGHTLYLDPTQDPTQYIYQNGGTNGMNAEHSYPQAKGATVGTNAHSDMHHLYPTRILVNEARADKPYADIPDQQTQKWFLNNQVFTAIPTQHIEQYAESTSTAFEPKEASKGDVARSILYFYTVYRSQANAADPNFFDIQRTTLCQWNSQDPADSMELQKTWRIATYQDSKPNPFVIDCTLATRSWCPDVAPNCAVSATQTPAVAYSLNVRIVPQPMSGMASVHMNLPFSGNLRGRILSLMGQELSIFEMKDAPSGAFSLPIDVTAFANSGISAVFLEINLFGSNGQIREMRPVLVAR